MPEHFDVARPSSARARPGRKRAGALDQVPAPSRLGLAATALRRWRSRQVLTMVVAAVVVTALIGFATGLIPNDVFSRDCQPEWLDSQVLLIIWLTLVALI